MHGYKSLRETKKQFGYVRANGGDIITDPMCADVKSRIAALKSQIHEHNYCYYVLDEPIIADVEYDFLIKELEELEREEENSTMNKFLRNFESRIYSRLSKELVESMFEAGEIDPNLDGRFYFSSEDYYIRYYMLDGRLMMETYPGKYGEEGSYDQCEETDLCTQIEVPVDSFSIYG